ncbi:hypothetical protein MNV49_004377 [Pseudohyphozyma bogoriensis]|nr:hypothetical protein MNV49_004377 [Pseudohyphozyma bogoriensis]
MSALSAPRRVTTGFTATGLSIIAQDEPVKMNQLFGGSLESGLVWMTDSLPADVQSGVDGGSLTPPGIVNPNGSVFNYLDLAPQASIPMHYTHSIDYGVLIKGEITMELDDRSSTVLRAGDSLVQNGTRHTFHNKSDEWIRILFVILPAKPVEIDGKPLEGLRLD